MSLLLGSLLIPRLAPFWNFSLDSVFKNRLKSAGLGSLVISSSSSYFSWCSLTFACAVQGGLSSNYFVLIGIIIIIIVLLSMRGLSLGLRYAQGDIRAHLDQLALACWAYIIYGAGDLGYWLAA